MFYQILSPVVTTINADSMNEAIKNYVKMNHNLRIQNILIKDNINNSYRAKVRYYVDGMKNKVGIDIYPGPTLITSNNNAYPLVPATLAPVATIAPVARIASVAPVAPVASVAPVAPVAPVAVTTTPIANLATITASPTVSVSSPGPGLLLNNLVTPTTPSSGVVLNNLATPTNTVNQLSINPVITAKGSPLLATNNWVFMKR